MDLKAKTAQWVLSQMLISHVKCYQGLYKQLKLKLQNTCTVGDNESTEKVMNVTNGNEIKPGKNRSDEME